MCFGEEKDAAKFSMRDMITHFHRVHLNELEKYLSKWYTKFNDLFGVNIFSKPFDRQKKYVIHNTDNYTILVLRYEDIGEWEKIFKNLFGDQLAKLTHTGVKDDINKMLEKKFKETYVFSEDEIKLAKNIDYMKHFYTQGDIDNIIAKYKKNRKQFLTHVPQLFPAPEKKVVNDKINATVKQKEKVKENHVETEEELKNLHHKEQIKNKIYLINPVNEMAQTESRKLVSQSSVNKQVVRIGPPPKINTLTVKTCHNNVKTFLLKMYGKNM